MFLIHDLDEIIVCRTAARNSYRNPVECIHAVANLCLQSVGMMRQKMSLDMELLIKNCNSLMSSAKLQSVMTGSKKLLMRAVVSRSTS